jgi:hypothetical protein
MRNLVLAFLFVFAISYAGSDAPELKVEDIKKENQVQKTTPAQTKTAQVEKKETAQIKTEVKKPAEPKKPAPAVNVNKKEVGEIDFRLGSINSKNRTKMTPLDEEDKVFEKDTLQTGKESRCEIKLMDGSILRLSENTKYIIDQFEQSGEKVSFQGYLVSGESWTNVNKLDSKKKDFKVKSPIAVAAVIGTSYKMTSDGKITEISVLDGQVEVDLEKEKKAELKIEPKKDSGSMAPKQSSGPKQIPGPYEVTLSEWISIVKGEKISIRNDGKYNKTKTDVNTLIQDWDSFKER